MKLNFRMKLFLGFSGFSAALVAAVLWYAYEQVADLPVQVSRELLLTGVANAVAQIDPADVAAIPHSGDIASSEAYRRVRAAFDRIHAAPPYFDPRGFQKYYRRRLLVRAPALREDNKELLLAVRTRRPNVGMLLVTLDPNQVGTECDMARDPAMRAGWKELAASHTIIEDDQGRALSAYAPIRDAKGKAIALFGMRARGELLDVAGRNIRGAAVVIFAVAVAASLLPALYFSWRLNRPIRALHEAMEQVARGRLDTRIERMRTRDEFEPLIEHFNEMTDGLVERDRLKRSLALAMEIQQHLLPDRPPELANFEIAGHSRYCDETGGDYYDFIELVEIGPEKLGIAVGDVTGHGIAAALLMASARAVLRSHAVRHGTDLAGLFEAINRHLVRDTGEERFMTLFYGILDGRERTLVWASAGHDPALWYRAETGRTEELPNTGIPLGITEDLPFEQAGPVHLAAGDVLVVGTDGIWEAPNAAGELFGKPRLREILQARHGEPAAKIRAAVIDAVAEFRGKVPQQDDITLVVLRAR
jgi:serine phosphatase RsbU (regulator of sigma subunit)